MIRYTDQQVLGLSRAVRGMLYQVSLLGLLVMAYEDDIRAIGSSPVDEVLELVRYVTEQFKLVLAQLVILLNPVYGQEIIQH